MSHSSKKRTRFERSRVQDHDIFDGWGSYSDELQATPVFQVRVRAYAF